MERGLSTSRWLVAGCCSGARECGFAQCVPCDSAHFEVVGMGAGHERLHFTVYWRGTVFALSLARGREQEQTR